MKDDIYIREAEMVEILTLQDNYADITVTDNNAVISRAKPLKAGSSGIPFSRSTAFPSSSGS